MTSTLKPEQIHQVKDVYVRSCVSTGKGIVRKLKVWQTKRIEYVRALWPVEAWHIPVVLYLILVQLKLK